MQKKIIKQVNASLLMVCCGYVNNSQNFNIKFYGVSLIVPIDLGLIDIDGANQVRIIGFPQIEQKDMILIS